MKYCTRCGKEKPLRAFGKHSRRGYQNYCKPCKREVDRVSWAKHKERRNSERRRQREATSNALKVLKGQPCADCGISYPYYVMDFDHVRGEKKFEISQAIRRSLSMEALMEEVGKCEIVCANCHRERTHVRPHSSAG